MSDYWTENAVKLHAELAAAQIELSAADDVIAANAGGWFAAMGENEKVSVIATMRNLASIDVHNDKFSPTSYYGKIERSPRSGNFMSELNKQESDALKATSEALVTIRSLASKPVTEKSRQVIMSLADAFHNIPDYAAMPASQREANAFMLTASIKQAQQVNKLFGLDSNHLPPPCSGL